MIVSEVPGGLNDSISHIPNLNRRGSRLIPEDIPARVRHFIAKYAERLNKRVDIIPPETMETMVNYDWPGNVRQLQNFVECGVTVFTASRRLPN